MEDTVPIIDHEINKSQYSFDPLSLSSLSQVPSKQRLLSANFVAPATPVRAAKQLPSLSLQDRLVGAEEATSAKVVGGFGPDEAVAWELFSPMQRVLIVAVNAVAISMQNKHSKQDQVRIDMQLKQENLCKLMNCLNDQRDSSSYHFQDQWDTSLIEQDFGNHYEQCEDKHAKINELSTIFDTIESLDSKSISELAGIIHCKNMIITELKKEIVVLEQKVNLAKMKLFDHPICGHGRTSPS